MYTLVDSCPECGSEEIQVIDSFFNAEEQVTEYRHICMNCNHDWYETEEE